jgi:hypothetical protein
MAKLSAAQLLKYDWRVEVFLKKYKDGDLFETTTEKVKLVYDDDNAEILKKRVQQELSKLRFRDAKNKEYRLTSFVKTKEFGGKGADSGVRIENIELKSLIKQIDEIKKKTAKADVPFRVGRKTYNVFTAVKTPGSPKSDIHLIDQNNREIVWISHKDGSRPTDIQQWGGMSERAEPKIFAQTETQNFIKKVRSQFGIIMPRATTVARKISSSLLKNMSVYGNQFGQALGRQNVSILLQGPIKVKKVGNFYELDANNVHLNGDEITGGFEPVFMAMYKGDRSNFGIRGARFVIQSLESRKAKFI